MDNNETGNVIINTVVMLLADEVCKRIEPRLDYMEKMIAKIPTEIDARIQYAMEHGEAAKHLIKQIETARPDEEDTNVSEERIEELFKKFLQRVEFEDHIDMHDLIDRVTENLDVSDLVNDAVNDMDMSYEIKKALRDVSFKVTAVTVE